MLVINIFGVERALKLPNGDEYKEEGTVSVYEETVGPKLVIEYKTEYGTLAKLKLNSTQVFQLASFMEHNDWI